MPTRQGSASEDWYIIKYERNKVVCLILVKVYLENTNQWPQLQNCTLPWWILSILPNIHNKPGASPFTLISLTLTTRNEGSLMRVDFGIRIFKRIVPWVYRLPKTMYIIYHWLNYHACIQALNLFSDVILCYCACSMRQRYSVRYEKCATAHVQSHNVI